MRRFFAAISLLLILTFVSVSESFAADEWIKVRSKNFYLVGNATDKDIRRIANKLEQFRVVFSNLFPNMNFVSPVPTTVIVFKSDKSFKFYKPQNAQGKTSDWVAGYFQAGEDINYITLTTEGEREDTFRTIFHEYVHFLVNNTVGKSKVPPWFNEGLAEYYEQFLIEDDQKVKLGGLNNNSLMLLSNTKLIPLETFFDIDYHSLHQQGGHGASIFYAQSWALMHYLIQGNQGKRNAQLATFMGYLADGMKTKEAFEKAFQTTHAVMDAELRKYVSQKTFNISIANFKQKLLFEADMQSEAMSEAEAKATLGDLLSHSNRLTDAEKVLREALLLDDNSVVANTALGYVKMRQKNFDEAKKHLEKAVAQDKSSFMVYYRYAYVLSREYVTEDMSIKPYSEAAADKMREALKRSIALNPKFADSHAQLGMISLVRNEKIEEGIESLNRAIALAPGNQNYQLNLASLYMNMQQYDKALPIVEAVAKAAEGPGTKIRAEYLLKNIREYKEYLARVGGEGGEGGPPRMGRGKVLVTPEDKPPTEEEIAKLRHEAEFDAISGALREPKPGEERVAVHVTKIECTGPNITFVARKGDQPIRFHSKDFQGLYLLALEPAFTSEIGCGTIKKEFYAILTFLPNPDAKRKTSGELLAIEVVPEKFDFLQEKAP